MPVSIGRRRISGRGNLLDIAALQAEIVRLGRSVESLAAIGAALRVRTVNDDVEAEIRNCLDRAAAVLLPGSLDSLDAADLRRAIAAVRQQLENAMELFSNPTRPGGWTICDPIMLDAQGQASREHLRRILQIAATRPAMQATLAGKFLDVGTGVAGIALEAAERCPSLRVVGIDIWEPSLTLARQHVAASPCAGRVQIRKQDVSTLSEIEEYTLAWLPTPFLKRPVVETALGRITAALTPGGYLVTGVYKTGDDPTVAALGTLRMVRSGGHIWRTEDLEELLRLHGFVNVETVTGLQSVSFVLGARPG
jgi:hypothetical protein